MTTNFGVRRVWALALPLALLGCGTEGSGDGPSSSSPDAQDAQDAAEAALDGEVEEAAPDVEAASAPRQRVLVIAQNDTTIYGELHAFEGNGGVWTHVFGNPVTLGRNGLGWGVGLHEPADIPAGEPIKHEGDGKAPMGEFALTQAWGYLPPESVATLMPYEMATPDLLCIDDVGSPYYNSVIDREAEGLPVDDLPSHEDMLRNDELYKYTIFVAHNSPNPVPGAGSCIFVHLWAHPDDSTAGCTAMAEADVVRLLEWLDPARSPTLVQLTRANYDRLRSGWDLPDLP